MLSAALSWLSPDGAAAQNAEATLPPPASFDEFFVGENVLPSMAQTYDRGLGVGRIIVGVAIGRPSAQQKIDLGAMRIALPAGEGDRLCVAISTSDGRYTAKSEHVIRARYAAPPRLGLTTRYADALQRYTAAELLVFAARAPSCSADAASQTAPAIAAEGAGELVAFVNIGRGRPKAWLETSGAPATDKARCRRDEHAAKTHDCAIPIAGLDPGPYELVVESGRLDGPSLIERTRLVLP